MDLSPATSELSIYVNVLSLLFNVYKSTKPSVAGKLDELIQELKRFKPGARPQTRAELDMKLEEKLLPEIGSTETEAVKRDLDLVAVFSEPIRVEDFDYLAVLSAYASKYAALADKASLFDLRGVTGKDESLLFLPNAGRFLLTTEEAAAVLCATRWPGYLTPAKVDAAYSLLMKSGADFRLVFSIEATFKCQNPTTLTSRVVEKGCRYVLANEGRKNWVKLEPRSPVDGFGWLSKRLDAEGVLRFMKAVRDDVMNYVSELRAEESLVKGEISVLLKEVVDFFEKADG
jgi:hypothetical protein